MFAVNQMVMHYKNGLSKIESIAYNQEKMCDCYKVVSNNMNKADYIEVNDKGKKIRELIKNEDLLKLISRMNAISDRMIKNKKEREFNYNNLCLFGNTEDLVIIVKRYYYLLKLYHPSYITLKEHEIFALAKQKLFEETSYVIGIPFEEAENYLFKTKQD